MTPLTHTLRELVSACFPGVWIQSFEHEDALAEIAALCREENWQLAVWDVAAGLQVAGRDGEAAVGSGGDPLAAIRAAESLGDGQRVALLVLHNFHHFLRSPEVIQAVARQLHRGKQSRTSLVILSPVVQLPIELEKSFITLEHDLPDRDQLAAIAQGVATEEGELPTGDEWERLLESAGALTRQEAEGAFSLSLVRHGRLQPQVIWELKSQMLKKSGLLGLHRGAERFATLGGLEHLKAFCLRALRRRSGAGAAAHRPRGVLLLSPPGCGKSQFAKTLGNEVGRPTLTLDIGSLLGSLVGQSEQNVRQALRIVDAMAPCVLFCDELEKGLAGVAGSGQTDSGVSARLFGHLLGWLNDHTSDVFVVATCNDISKLPPEFARAERFDGVFFVDLPSAAQRAQIWNIYLDQFALERAQPLPPDEGWTGAEIRSCCRLAALLDVPLAAAAQNVVPVAVTAAEAVERLRTWASGRCLSADAPGVYQRSAATTARRRVSRDPSSN